jgi:MFS transporter, MHS family, proline/betaine transporter
MDSNQHKIPYKALMGGIVGNAFEFYDFTLFGLLAPTISPLFFPLETRMLSILAGYLTFAVGYFVRPLGAVIFGHIGDRYGRRTALYLCLLLMAIATLIIGITPTYKTIGIFAPCFVIFARILQGFSAGGEFAGGLTFIVEHTDKRRAGFAAGLALGGGCGGIFFGSIAALIFTLPNMPIWAWRVPFIIGFFVALAGLYIRLFLEETPAYIKTKEKEEIQKIPLITGIKRFYKQFIFSVFLYVFCGALYYVNVVAFPLLLEKTISVSAIISKTSNALKMLTLVVMIPVFGYLSDKIEKAILSGISIVLLIIFAFLCLYVFYMKVPLSIPSIFLCQFIAGVIASLEMGAVNIFLLEAFGAKVRYSCFAVSQAIGMGFSGAAPFLVTLLINNNSYFTLSSFIAIAGTLALFSVYGVWKLKFEHK